MRVLSSFTKKIIAIGLIIAALSIAYRPLLKAAHAVLLRTSLGPALVSWLSRFDIYHSKAKPRLLRPEMVQMLYQTVKDVHQAMQICEVPYWIDFGTLLGAVRHQGFIPWDDDIDLSIRETDKDLFLHKCAPLLRSWGYRVEKGEGFEGVCVFPKDFPLLPKEKMPGCDIFFSQAVSGGWKNKGIGVFIGETDLMPLRQYKFGPLLLWGPQNPIPSLDKEYGKNWRELAEMGYDHHTVKEAQDVKKVPFVLKSFQPALPVRPLIDRPLKPLEETSPPKF
jgi:lipopolysaccharide cholinephosphotransferase